ncbi:hypothetical protein PRZ48_013273 [Zasmidium cellare]|uniref:ATP-grasp domain-containing protein n=1 Tax=Zasmidium cellare TaxID=395010 RepID=A0ABR0E3V2_ZASCE|nr:hypothetical protein PRZ48_013273 [Zasmidium cellare]
MKPGGYQDSGADIAYVLRETCKIPIVTPQTNPDPQKHEGWCFPDTEEGILSAVKSGANCLWANTILFGNHPWQVSTQLGRFASDIRVVGQPPRLVEAYDDKNFVNAFLRKQGSFTMPKSFVAPNSTDIESLLKEHGLTLPVVAKPIRGRGSQGVKVCRTIPDLASHIDSLGPHNAMLEEYLSGIEGTVTVMPPSESKPDYWSMPVVVRFNHEDGIAPYNGVVAVTANSRVVPQDEADQDPAFDKVQRECEAVARLLKVKAPIRIDVRKASEKAGSKFVLFDVNMKPNMTAPGRPGREDQASLTALAAAGLGWTPADLLRNILATASTLEELRSIELPIRE